MSAFTVNAKVCILLIKGSQLLATLIVVAMALEVVLILYWLLNLVTLATDYDYLFL